MTRPFFHQQARRAKPPRPCRECGRKTRTLNGKGHCGACAKRLGEAVRGNWTQGLVFARKKPLDNGRGGVVS